MASLSSNTPMTRNCVAVTKSNLSFNVQKFEQCLSYLHTWFSLNGLALKPDKSEAIILRTWQRSRTLPFLTSIDVAGCTVPVSFDVKIIGVTLDSALSLTNTLD